MTARGYSTSLVALCSIATALYAQLAGGHPYYPLSVGNTWTYVVQPDPQSKEPSIVKWKVTGISKTRSGQVVYQVWPTPMQVDDEAMQLEMRHSGLVESDTGGIVLPSPLKPGDEWTRTDRANRRTPIRSYRVRSAGLPCMVGSRQFADCAVVEDTDQQTRMRTVTTYAKGIGPIEYRYFSLQDEARQQAVQTVTLKSFQLVP